MRLKICERCKAGVSEYNNRLCNNCRIDNISRKKYIRVAHKILNLALKNGRIIKPKICDLCGAEKKLEGHHDDYEKPLQVLWLCKKCHYKRHKEGNNNYLSKNGG